MKSRVFIILLFISNFVFGQSSQEIMKSELEKMKFLFLNKSYKGFSTFVYPKVIQMYGNEEKMIEKTKSSILEMENDGFKFVNIYFKNFNDAITKNNELQSTFTQVILMNTPKGKIIGEYTMIGISSDNGKSWKFIDTSGYDEKIIQNNFPNLDETIIIKPQVKMFLDENNLRKKCSEFKNIELQSISPFSFKKASVVIFDNKTKETAEDGSYIASKVVRNIENPCKMDFIIEEIQNKAKNMYKIGDIMHMELTGFENEVYYFIATLNNNDLITSDKFKVVKTL